MQEFKTIKSEAKITNLISAIFLAPVSSLVSLAVNKKEAWGFLFKNCEVTL